MRLKTPSTSGADGEGPLAGIRVLDASQMLAGPICGMRLGDLGADVLKIEPPVRGEWTRNRYLCNVEMSGQSTAFLALNRNKRSVTINFKSDAGLEVLYALVRDADVFIQNFRVGTADRIGVGYDKLYKINPKLIYCSISGYGESGPYAYRAGQDLIIQGYSGSLWTVGREDDPPIPNALWAADVMSGYQAAIGILSAVIARSRLGEGQKVEVNMLATVMDCEIQELTTHLNSGLLPERTKEPSAHAWIGAPYGIYETADGYIALGYVPIDELAEVLECEELKRFPDVMNGVEHRDEIECLVAERIVRRTTVEWLDEMLERGFMAGPVYTYEDLVSDPHVRETEMIAEVEHPGGGVYKTPNVPLNLSITPPRISRRPPRLGEHTDEILQGEIGLDGARLAAMHQAGDI